MGQHSTGAHTKEVSKAQVHIQKSTGAWATYLLAFMCIY